MLTSGMPDEPASIDDYKLSVYQVAAILRETPAEVRARTEALRQLRKARQPKPKAHVARQAAARKRRYKARLERDMVVLSVEAERVPFIDALISSGRISEPDALFRDKIEAATARLLADWAQRWERVP